MKTVSRVQSDQDVQNCEIETQDCINSRGANPKERKVLKGAVRGTAMGALGALSLAVKPDVELEKALQLVD